MPALDYPLFYRNTSNGSLVEIISELQAREYFAMDEGGAVSLRFMEISDPRLLAQMEDIAMERIQRSTFITELGKIKVAANRLERAIHNYIP